MVCVHFPEGICGVHSRNFIIYISRFQLTVLALSVTSITLSYCMTMHICLCIYSFYVRIRDFFLIPYPHLYYAMSKYLDYLIFKLQFNIKYAQLIFLIMPLGGEPALFTWVLNETCSSKYEKHKLHLLDLNIVPQLDGGGLWL